MEGCEYKLAFQKAFENYYDDRLNITLWRYMKFERFKRLVSDKKLYLCPLHKFDDVFEGR